MVFASWKDMLECAKRTNKAFRQSYVPNTPENTKILENLTKINEESLQICYQNTITSISDNPSKSDYNQK